MTTRVNQGMFRRLGLLWRYYEPHYFGTFTDFRAESLVDQDQIILDHYKRVAELFGHAPTSTMKDQKIRNAEVEFFKSEIMPLYLVNPKLKILDIGCGNGFLLSVLKQEFPVAKLTGLEFTPELFELAKSRDLKETNIIQGDCRIPNFHQEKADIIITERVVINILKDEDRIQVLRNISKLLGPDGVYLMSESFQEPLDNLNRARVQNLMEEIVVPEKNHYLLENELETLKAAGLVEKETILGKNYLSTWFFTSRILHHLFKPKGARNEGADVVKFFMEGIGPGVGNYSPILFRKFSR